MTRRPQDVRLKRPSNVKSELSRDSQIESLGDVLVTLKGDVLGISGRPIFVGWVYTPILHSIKLSEYKIGIKFDEKQLI